MQRPDLIFDDGLDYAPAPPGAIAYAVLILLVLAAAVGMRWLYLGWARIW